MVIAERILSIRRSDGTVKVPIRIFAPLKSSRGGWTCRYEIDWPEGLWALDVAGVDAVQAIVLTFHMIGSDIYTSSYHEAGQLFFETPGDGYGFPVPITLRDLLRSADKAFF
jgi:hypothetical protein